MTTATATIAREMDLAELVRAHQATVWRYLRFLGCDEAEAEDITQETFLAVWRKPFEYRSPAATVQYLRRVAKNLYLMSLRKQQRDLIVADLEAAEAVWARFAPDDRPDAFLDALTQCLGTIGDRARQAIELRYRDDASRADIGRQLDLTEDGVKTLLRRTRESLRECMKRRLKHDLAE